MKTLKIQSVINNELFTYVTLEVVFNRESKTEHKLEYFSKNGSYNIFACDTVQEISVTNNLLRIESPYNYIFEFDLVDSIPEPVLIKEKDRFIIARDTDYDVSLHKEMLNNVVECAKLLFETKATFRLGRVQFCVDIVNKKVTIVMNKKSMYSYRHSQQNYYFDE